MDNKKKKLPIIYSIIVFVCIAVFAIVIVVLNKIIPSNTDNITIISKEQSDNAWKAIDDDSDAEAEATTTPTAEPVAASHVSLDNIYSYNALLVKRSDHTVVAEKNADLIIFPASMTKVMTAIVAIENLPDLDEQITITQEDIDTVYEEGASLAGFEAYETVSVRDLLYGVLLPSGGEACVTLANRISGSQEAFVEMMNNKAMELGMGNTHFVTDSGLHDDNHFTTCRELAVLLDYALNNATFREISSSHSYVTTPTEQHPEGMVLDSTLFSKVSTDTFSNGGVLLGGKTGFTDEAQLCLASYATVGGEEYMLITAHAEGNHETEQFNITDAFNIYSQL